MDVVENKDEKSEESNNNENSENPCSSREQAKKEKRRDRDYKSQCSCSTCSSVMGLKIKDQKTPAPRLGSKKIRMEKRVKKRRPVGRVEKRRKGRARTKRRFGFTAFRTRGHSASTEESRGSHTPPPKCKYCGHRCCMQR